MHIYEHFSSKDKHIFGTFFELLGPHAAKSNVFQTYEVDDALFGLQN